MSMDFVLSAPITCPSFTKIPGFMRFSETKNSSRCWDLGLRGPKSTERDEKKENLLGYLPRENKERVNRKIVLNVLFISDNYSFYFFFNKEKNSHTKYTIMFFYILKYVIWNIILKTFFTLWVCQALIFTTFFKL